MCTIYLFLFLQSPYRAYPRNHRGLVGLVLIMNNLAFIGTTIFTLFTSVTCQLVIKLIQGEKAHLTFRYDCNCTEITLQHGYKSPFYRSTNPASITLASYPESRFIIENIVTTEVCSIHLSINPVHRNDAGTYITQVYKNGGDVLPDMQRIGLNVDYPPGEASCEWREGSSVGDWGLLQCTATAGTLSGLFECYQRGERLPPYTTQTKHRNKLEQTIWVRLSHPVFCCTATQELPKDQCQCKEYVWAPASFGKPKRAVEPCSATTYIPNILTSQIPSAESMLGLEAEVLRHQSSSKHTGKSQDTTSLATPTKTTPIPSLRIVKETVVQLSKWIYVIVFGIFVVIVLCLMTLIKLCHMSPKNIRDKKSDCV